MFKKIVEEYKKEFEALKYLWTEKSIKYLDYSDRELIVKMRKSVKEYLEPTEMIIFDTIMESQNIRSYLVFTNKRILILTPTGFRKKDVDVSVYTYESIVNIQKGRTKSNRTLFRFNITNKYSPQPAKIKVYKETSYQVLKYLTMSEPPLF